MNKGRAFTGVMLFLVALGLFTLLLVYFYANKRFGIEFIDHRLFYVINVSCAFFLALSTWLVLSPSKKWMWVGLGTVILFTIVNAVLLSSNNKDVHSITVISPDWNNILSIRVNAELGEASYYRPLYGIFARQKDRFQLDPNRDVKVEWLADDIAAVTYQNVEGNLQQFIATYGDRGEGTSYYYVAAEIFGVWESEGIKVICNTDGISVIQNGQTELFDWNNIKQFGTLAVVLKRGHEDVWTIGLNENFKVQSNPTVPQPGEIILYEVTIDKNTPFYLHYQGMSE